MNRHKHEVELLKALSLKKEAEMANLLAQLEQVEKDFLAMSDYQNALSETAELKEKIEFARVKVQYLDVQVSLLTEANEYLSNKRDELMEENK